MYRNKMQRRSTQDVDVHRKLYQTIYKAIVSWRVKEWQTLTCDTPFCPQRVNCQCFRREIAEKWLGRTSLLQNSTQQRKRKKNPTIYRVLRCIEVLDWSNSSTCTSVSCVGWSVCVSFYFRLNNPLLLPPIRFSDSLFQFNRQPWLFGVLPFVFYQCNSPCVHHGVPWTHAGQQVYILLWFHVHPSLVLVTT